MLIDTNVWSELTRPRPDLRVISFLANNGERLVLSTIVLAEIEFGIANAPDPIRAGRLAQSRDDILLRIADRVLLPDDVTAAIWGKLKTELDGRGKTIPDFDLLICAQAIAAGMPVVTRNEEHMARTGATIINPWLP